MPSSCWRRRPPTSRTRRSPSCSCRPSTSPKLGALLATRRRALAGRAARSGRRISPSSKARRSASRRSRPTARASSAAAATSATPIAVIDGTAAVQHRRHRARSDLRLRRRVRVPPGGTVRIAFWTVVASSRDAAARPRRQASRRATRSSARRRWPGRRRRCSCAISASTPDEAACSSGSPATCSMPIRALRAVVGHDPARRRRRSRRCGRRASPATCRSCWCASTTSRTSRIVRAAAAAPTNTGGMKQLAVDLVILNERGASYVQDLQIALETLVRTSQSRPRLGERADARRASSCCAPT